MKTFIRTVSLCVALSLATVGSALAQEPPDLTNPPSVAPAPPAPPRVPPARPTASPVAVEPRVPTPDAPARLPALSISAPEFRLTTSGGHAGSVLVIPAADMKAEDLLTITEDMNVMSRIFERNLQRAHIVPVGTSIFASKQNVLSRLFVRGGQTTQSMYLQGYGALFLMTVDFPLSPGPQVQEEKQTQEDEDVDPVWEQMKREMYEPEAARRRRTIEAKEEKYDAEKVAELKESLIKALKHAANIRNLKPDESVILTVTGGGGSAGLVSQVTSTDGKMFVVDSDGTTRIIQDLALGGAADIFPTTLVIRAKKSDIDALAKGDLDLDQFRQRVQVLACPYLGGVVGRGDSPHDPYQYSWSRSAPDGHF